MKNDRFKLFWKRKNSIKKEEKLEREFLKRLKRNKNDRFKSLWKRKRKYGLKEKNSREF